MSGKIHKIIKLNGMSKLRLMRLEHYVRDLFRSRKKVSPAKFMLSELQRDFRFFQYNLEALEQELGKAWMSNAKAEYNLIYSRFNDALKVLSEVVDTGGLHQECDFIKLLCDFSESYAARFGAGYASNIRIHIDPSLPIFRVPISPINTFIDAIVRSVKGLNMNNKVALYVQPVNSQKYINNEMKVKLVAIGQRIAYSDQIVSRRLKEFANSNFGYFVRDLGVELCATLLQARNLKAEFNLINTDDTSHYEFTLNLPIHTKSFANIKVPKTFYLHSNVEDTEQAFEGFAQYFGNRLQVVKDIKSVPVDGRLIYDASTFDDSEILRLVNLRLPSDTIIILPPDSWGLRNKLSMSGLRFFTSVPFVSTHYLNEGLAAFEYSDTDRSQQQTSSSRSILVVDDAPTARLLLKNYFLMQGVNVSEASNGNEMHSLITSGNKYDVIFCDLNMPELDGPEAVKRLRAYEKELGLAKTPVALMTAYASDAEELSKNLPDFDECLLKPVNLEAASAFLGRFKPDDAARRVNKMLADYELKKNLHAVLAGRQDASASVSNETTIIVLDELKGRCSGKNELVCAVIEAFLAGCKTQVIELGSTEVRSDKTKWLRCLHGIKGLLRDVAASDAANVIQALEEKYNKSDVNLESVGDDFHAVELVYEQARTAAEKILSELR